MLPAANDEHTSEHFTMVFTSERSVEGRSLMSDDSDEQLLIRLRRSDEAAFETLFMRYYTQVYRVLYRLTGTREAAEDLAQETFLTLYDNPPRLAWGTTLAAWLCRVALNRGYNALRGERRAALRIEQATEAPRESDPQAEALRAEERSRVRAILERLPERQSKLLLLRHAGLSYAEIAAVLDVAPGSIGTLLARAERAFAVAYQQSEPVEREV
ncbi:MAG TPA: sigma-70 family RNA polymerase sigma factor [Herpetosiphonaceae bacterium]